MYDSDLPRWVKVRITTCYTLSLVGVRVGSLLYFIMRILWGKKWQNANVCALIYTENNMCKIYKLIKFYVCSTDGWRHDLLLV